jgi:hypothetical protein
MLGELVSDEPVPIAPTGDATATGVTAEDNRRVSDPIGQLSATGSLWALKPPTRNCSA